MISHREARMHARQHQWIVWTLTFAAIGLAGCRGTRPHDSLVKVTKEPGIAGPDVEAPRQRLAVNKPKSPTDQVDTTSLSEPPVNRPAVTQNAATSGPTRSASATPRSTPARAATRPSSDTVSVSFNDRPASREAGAEPRVAATTQAKPASAKLRSSKPGSEDSNDAGATVSSIAEMTEEEMMAAFKDQPQYIQDLVQEQLMAAISRKAERTTQPASVDDAIAKSMDNLPDLPPETGREPAVPAQRIASNTTSSANQTTPKAGADPDAGRQPENHGGLESVVVQSISDQPTDGGVKPASAAQDAADTSMVARAAADSPEPDADPSPSMVAPTDLSDEALYAELLKRLSKAPLGESEADRSSRLIKQRHLMVLAGNPDAAVEKIDAMSEAEQEYLRHQLLGLWTMVDPEGHPVPSRRFTTALPQMREATKFAAAATDSLDVRSLAFCTAIESYGQIKRFAGNHFNAGEQVILYCEIENFTVTESPEGYQTHLQGSYDIYNAENEKVVSQLLPADKQVSANYLRDYFIAYQMHLPQQLSPGTYRLQLTMEDVSGKKYGQASIPLEITK